MLNKLVNKFLPVILIIILGFSIYSSSLNGKFIWDDELLIEDNIYIKDFSYLPKIFSENIQAGIGRKTAFYRPIQMLTYMLDYSWGKLNVKAYHFHSVFWHVFTSLCLYWLVNAFYKDRRLALLTSLFFAAHPIHTEAVAYISGRADSLAAAFMLVCFIFFVKCRHKRTIFYGLMIIISYTLSLLSKESSLILAALLLLYLYTFNHKHKIAAIMPVLIITGVYIALRLTILKFEDPASSFSAAFLQRLSAFFVAVTNYTKLLILPFNLHMEYGCPPFDFICSRAVAGMFIIGAAAVYLWRQRHKKTLGFFGLSWFFIAFLPVSNLYKINAYMAEHWMYIPSIGIFLILANTLNSMLRRRQLKVFAAVLIVSLLGFYSYLTFKQNAYWQDPVTFYERTLKYAASARMNSNLANLYVEQGRVAEAIVLHKKAIEEDPAYAGAYNNLANIYHNLGKKEEAVALYKKAIELDAGFVDAYNNLGVAYGSIGKNKEAIEAFNQAIELSPIHVGVYTNLAVLYLDIGQPHAAIATFKKATETVPCAATYANLANAYKKLGRLDEAIEVRKKIIEFTPDDAGAYSNLGVLYMNTGKIDEAITIFKKSMEIDPGYAAAYNNLGIAYGMVGKHEPAVLAFTSALELEPQARGYYNLAVAYFRQKDYKSAVKYCDKAQAMGFSVDPEFLADLAPYR